MTIRITPVPTDATKYIDCLHCSGKGYTEDIEDVCEECQLCNGSGEIEDEDPTEEKPFFEPEQDFY